MTIRIAEISDEDVRVFVTLNVGGNSIDLEAFPVFLAFPDIDIDPEDADWIAATWEGDEGTEHGAHAPPGKPAGSYDIWARVDGETPEVFRGKAGKLVVE